MCIGGVLQEARGLGVYIGFWKWEVRCSLRDLSTVSIPAGIVCLDKAILSCPEFCLVPPARGCHDSAFRIQMILVAELGNGGEGTGAGVSSWVGDFSKSQYKGNRLGQGRQSLFRVYSDSVVRDREVCHKCHYSEKSMYLVYLYERMLMSPHLRVLQNRNTSFPVSSCLPFLSVSPSSCSLDSSVIFLKS